MNSQMQVLSTRLTLPPQRGAALVVGLILLLVLTVLAISGVMTSTMELRMVTNSQQQERAFQAADTGVERAIANAEFTTSGAAPLVQEPVDPADPAGDRYEYTLRFADDSALPTVPTGFSLGAGLQAYHFQVDAQGFSAGGATSSHRQGFYIIGPGGG
jgi:type IV pilus assembly protein PilX